MPFEIPASEPVVQTVLDATHDVGRTGAISRLDSWYDGATLTALGGSPAHRGSRSRRCASAGWREPTSAHFENVALR